MLFRDPRNAGKPCRKSLKTTDRAVAEQYKTHLDRIITDKTLWRNPPADTPQLVREIWFGAEADVELEVDGQAVRTIPLPHFQKQEMPFGRSNIGTFNMGKFIPVEADYNPVQKAHSFASAVQSLRADLAFATASNAALKDELQETKQRNAILLQRLNQYERRAIKAGVVDTLQKELDAYLAEFEKRKMNPSHRGSVIYVLKRFIRETGPERNAADVDEREVERYVSQRTQDDGSPLSEQMRYKIRQWVCTFLVKCTNGEFDRTAVKSVKEHMITREQRQIVWLEREEARGLVSKMTELFGTYWGDLAEIQLGMGWRPEELILLQKEYADGTTLTLEPISDAENNHVWGKTGSRSIRIPRQAQGAVQRRLATDDSKLLFARPLHNGETYASLALIDQKWISTSFDRSYHSRLKKAASAAGIVKHVVCRTLRTTFGSLMIRDRRTPYEVAKLMGDRVKTVERHYARLLAEEIDTELGPVPVRQS